MARYRPSRASQTRRGSSLPHDARSFFGGGGQEGAAVEVQTENAAQRLVSWVRYKPVERAPVLAIPALYGAGGGVYLANTMTGIPPWWGISIFGGGLAWASAASAWKNTADPVVGKKVGALGTAVTAWLAWAAEFSPWAGPSAATAWFYGAIAAGAYGAYRADPKIKGHIRRRDERRAWPQVAEKVGLGKSKLLSKTETRLGELYRVSTKATGKTATSWTSGNLAELIAQECGLPKTRVRVRGDSVAGIILIDIRYADPWAKAIPHPVDDPDHEIGHLFTGPRSAAVPIIVGQDPDTGAPLTLTIFNDDGGRHTMIVAVTRGGKTVLLNNILEWLTASDDAIVWGIDGGKGKNVARWRYALDMVAAGIDERAKGVAMLGMARKVIEHRAKHNQQSVWVPSRDYPLLVIVIDEINKLVGQDPLGQQATSHLAYITSTGASEGVLLVQAGQRATAAQLGNNDVRTQIANVVMLKFNRKSEMNHAVGPETATLLPDMSKYGEGKAGVVCIAEADGSDFALGRTFGLGIPEFRDLERVEELARERANTHGLEVGVAEVLGDRYTTQREAALVTSAAVSTATSEVGPVASEVVAPEATPAAPEAAQRPPASGSGDDMDWMKELGKDLLSGLDDETRAKFEGIKARNAEVAEVLANTGPVPEVTPEQIEAMQSHALSKRYAEAERTVIPDAHRARLLDMLTYAGTNGAKTTLMAQELGLSGEQTTRYLYRLAFEGLASLKGAKRGARWYLRTEGGGDDS
jgi:hypothetical protein